MKMSKYHLETKFILMVITISSVYESLFHGTRTYKKWWCPLQGVPGDGRFDTTEQLSQVITSIIFASTVGHAAVNVSQYDEYAYLPNYPATLKGQPPRDKVRSFPTSSSASNSALYHKKSGGGRIFSTFVSGLGAGRGNYIMLLDRTPNIHSPSPHSRV